MLGCYILQSTSIKCLFKSFQQDDILPMLYKSNGEVRIDEPNFEWAHDDYQNSSDDDALFKNSTSSDRLEMEYEEDGNPESCP